MKSREEEAPWSRSARTDPLCLSAPPPAGAQWENNALQIQNEFCAVNRLAIDPALALNLQHTNTHALPRSHAPTDRHIFIWFYFPYSVFPRFFFSIYGSLYWLSIFITIVWHVDGQKEMTADWLGEGGDRQCAGTPVLFSRTVWGPVWWLYACVFLQTCTLSSCGMRPVMFLSYSTVFVRQ